ncbi:uncharacterized protein Fot_11256 [Forsythia ovata]|uniref:Uncharacterized protein n=1 Tax=Forsythia ovata TaxID=205694 RepID=A0ABD1WJJ7_9LAMI
MILLLNIVPIPAAHQYATCDRTSSPDIRLIQCSSRNDATTETGPQPIPERPRKRRGPTQGFQIAHIVKVTQQKLEVIIEKEETRATGPNAPRFANEIGAANVFVLDYDKRPWIKEVIENDMPIRFKEFRYELHEYYETLIDLPMAERKAKKHDQVLNQDYWDFLCDYWESEAFKKKSKRNATNRAKLTHGHCSGSRSFLNTQAMGVSYTCYAYLQAS